MVLRTSFIGHELFDNKSLLNWFLYSSKKKVNGYDKAFFSGLTNFEISNFICKIILKNNFHPGIFNLSGYKISKYNLLKIINKTYNSKKMIYKNTSFRIDRSLNNKKIKSKFKFKVKSWSLLVSQMKSDYKKYIGKLY